MAEIRVLPADVRDPRVRSLVDALTEELAAGGYGAAGTFGYSAEKLASSGVHLVAAVAGEEVVGIGGVEVTGSAGELKRFYVTPSRRGSGAAAALLESLLAHARDCGVRELRLETGDKQHAALAFYRRHGFTEIPRFGAYVASRTSICMQRTL